MLMKRIKTALLISGSGTTAEAIIKAAQKGLLSHIVPVVVIASSSKAKGIVKARKLNIPVVVIDPKKYEKKLLFAQKLKHLLTDYKVDLISQNGWFPLTPKEIVIKYRGRIINQHPGPLDPGNTYDFGGKGMYGKRVTAAKLIYSWLTNSDYWTESTVHFVTDEYDKGDLIRIVRINLPKPAILISKTLIERDTATQQKIKKTVEEIQKQLLPIEHKNVIEALRLLSLGNVQKLKRNKKLIPVCNEQYLIDAKQLAIRLFPYG